jgi:manganese transport protein
MRRTILSPSASLGRRSIFLHSGLTQNRAPARNENERRNLVRVSNVEVIVAGAVNIAMVTMAASAFHAGRNDVAEIEPAYSTLSLLLGAGAAGVFPRPAALLRSIERAAMAGQLIMQGVVGFRIPIAVRRRATMIPAFVVVALGVSDTQPRRSRSLC